MASAPKPIRTKAGTAVAAASSSVQVPPDTQTLQAAIEQLQNTLNELIARHNTLCDDTAHAADKVTGAGAAATNLFTDA